MKELLKLLKAFGWALLIMVCFLAIICLIIISKGIALLLFLLVCLTILIYHEMR